MAFPVAQQQQHSQERALPSAWSGALCPESLGHHGLAAEALWDGQGCWWDRAQGREAPAASASSSDPAGSLWLVLSLPP